MTGGALLQHGKLSGTNDLTEGWIRRTPPLVGGVSLGLLFLSLMWLLLGMIYHFGILQHTEIAEDRLKRLTVAAAAIVDGDAHERLVAAEQTGSKEYLRLIDPLVNFHNQVDDIYWLYTMRVVDGKLRYVLDTAQSPRSRYTRDPALISSIMDPVTDYSLEAEPGMLPHIMSGAAHLNARAYGYGTLMLRTAEAPIHDSQGRVVAMLGADLEVGTFLAEQRRFKILILVAAFASLLIAIAIALLTMLLHARLRAAMVRLEQESITDTLTGLYNRAYFNRSLATQVALARRNRQQLTLLTFDIDNFKRINDTFGHGGGDEVLRSIGKRLTAVLRSSDTCCRIGGEEFALLMPGVDSEVGTRVFGRLNNAIREPLPLDGVAHVTTISGGIAELDDDPDAENSLLLRADKALYEAKRTGRDRVIVDHNEAG
ncbi:MAG: GGDEF domain-containing protein [Gammaproteobacteria bacterium]|nr:GGDEF domain-containing protein [Gammaproteobacteria bacterium]MBP6050753.1 GGDEF domain-containing protein [Pseudomonadales bacterium]MBK6584457.1 GGDEF domain-containing protein [Gammaproteobacteria bacterium]MBK7168305.1 GGDEF domain-containing protein [Gammaproteobacteria bacterium]MBK7520915.1 GGDEF domain-containing protein [Gammaproteobacteria bacterium]